MDDETQETPPLPSLQKQKKGCAKSFRDLDQSGTLASRAMVTQTQSFEVLRLRLEVRQGPQQAGGLVAAVRHPQAAVVRVKSHPCPVRLLPGELIEAA